MGDGRRARLRECSPAVFCKRQRAGHALPYGRHSSLFQPEPPKVTLEGPQGERDAERRPHDDDSVAKNPPESGPRAIGGRSDVVPEGMKLMIERQGAI